MSDQPKEAFPWSGNRLAKDEVVDANGRAVCHVYGHNGSAKAEDVPGIAERRRMILEVPNLIELARQVAYGIHYCPKQMVGNARKILSRIEGRTT